MINMIKSRTKKEVILRGEYVDYNTCVGYMDEELRERLHSALCPCTDQDFLDAYAESHYEIFGVEFLDEYL